MRSSYLIEALGTFVLVLIGCGTVTMAVLFDSYTSLFQVAAMWGMGVTLAIEISKTRSHAHLNPAVSLAMVVLNKYPIKQLLPLMLSQLLGAVLAGICLFLMMQGHASYQEPSLMFGEFFPNPSYADHVQIDWIGAMLAEAMGTFALVMAILWITRGGGKLSLSQSMLIGLAVSSIIMVLAPYTQAGINPARDLGPRLVAYIAGWRDMALAGSSWPQSIAVYVAGPFLGAAVAAKLAQRLRFA
ncbi:MAG: aquaporin family protein [Flavobacteriales bacterium]|nr:aquaporin family protein [Flavobacteriales bacterium]